MERAEDRRGSALTASAHPAVVLSGVTSGYGQRAALKEIDLDVPSGSLLAVVGPNGAGKSTLLKVIAGLAPVWEGDVGVLGGMPGTAGGRIAYVPQAELVDWTFPVTVGDVVMMGRFPRMRPWRHPRPADRDAVTKALRMVAMIDHAGARIGALSGGQRRRVFLARALAAEPDLYLLDEPVTGIDAVTQEELMDVLEREVRAGRTVVATTHDLACAASRFHRVLALNQTVVADGGPSIVLDAEVLRRTYGGHLFVLDGRHAILDDAHHHDEGAAGEPHFHEYAERR